MSFLKKIAGGVLGAVIGKKPKAAAPQPQTPPAVPTRNLAAEAARRRDLLSERRGTLANIITGRRGAEAAGTGAKTKLGN